MYLTSLRPLVLALTLFCVAPFSVAASEKEKGSPIRSAAVPEAFLAKAGLDQASVAKARLEARPSTSRTMMGLYTSYGILSGLDMYSTVQARNNGARELNPLLNTGYAQATARKAIFTATTILAVRQMAKRHKRAAKVTMVILNVVNAAVVAHNLKNARP